MTGNKEWVDPADYDQLIDRLKTCGPSATGSLYVSGLIAGDDQAVLGWTFAQPKQESPLDFAPKPGETPSTYAIMLLDGKGTTLSESELPLNWNLPETAGRTDDLGAPAQRQRPQVEHAPERHQGVVSRRRLVREGSRRRCADHFVQVSPDRGAHWWPVAHALAKPATSVILADVRRGTYLVRVVSSDGVNVTMSQATIAL